MVRLFSFLIILAMAAPAWGTPAWATAPRRVAADSAETQARQLFRQAEVHFGLREFDRALELYSEAYRLKPLPGFLFNIAQCHRFSGRYEDAAFTYRMYLQRAPEAANRAEVEDLVREMEAAAQASLQSEAVAPPAQIEPAPPPSAPPPALAPAITDEAVAPSPLERSLEFKPWIWGLGGVGAALVATGLVTGQMASSRSERFNDPATPESELRQLFDSGRALVRTSVASLAVGAAAVVGAGTLWFWGRAQPTEGSAPAAQSPIALVAAPLSGGFSMACVGGF